MERNVSSWEIKNRPNSNAWIESAKIIEPLATFKYGDKMILEVRFRSLRPIYPYLGIVITSIFGVKLINSNNRYQNDHSDFSKTTNGIITCDFNSLPLMKGTYFISLFFGDYLGDEHIIENALAFDVNEKDIWGKGKFPPTNSSELWWPTNYKISQ